MGSSTPLDVFILALDQVRPLKSINLNQLTSDPHRTGFSELRFNLNALRLVDLLLI